MTTDPQLNQALPGWAVDAITDGLDTRDARKVYAKCVSIAMSAHLRGWTENRYVNEIASPTSRLWAQLMTRRDGRTSSMPAAMKALRKAWAVGVANTNNVGMRTRDEIRDDAVELAYDWADRLDAGTDNLSATEIAVMQYVITETERRGMLKVTCPGRAIEESHHVGYRTATRTLKALAARGLLTQHSVGRGGAPGTRKAAIYGLVDPAPVSHINGGSIPMGQGVRAEVDEPDPEIVVVDREEPAAAVSVSHRETAHFSPTDVDVFLFDVSDNCGIDVDDMTPVEATYCAWAYEHAGDAETVAEGILDARAAAEVVRRAGDDPTGMSIVELLSVHAECGDAEADPVETYRAMSA